MNVNAVPDLLDHTVKRSMLAHQVHVQIMASVSIYHRDTMAMPINVYARMVSVFPIFTSFLHAIKFNLRRNAFFSTEKRIWKEAVNGNTRVSETFDLLTKLKEMHSQFIRICPINRKNPENVIVQLTKFAFNHIPLIHKCNYQFDSNMSCHENCKNGN